MTMVEQRIQQQFFEGADLQYQAAESLARPVAQAAAALLSALTGGGKIMVCGTGAGSHLAGLVAQLFVGGHERERPPLAALALPADGLQALQALRALGLPGDVLLLIDDGQGNCAATIAAAQGKDMTVVVLTGRGAAAVQEWLAETDVLVTVPAERPARLAELQLLVLHCLCDAVDFQLMGELDP
jgi:D-sedoheptulose 7-phosphate isomerase